MEKNVGVVVVGGVLPPRCWEVQLAESVDCAVRCGERSVETPTYLKGVSPSKVELQSLVLSLCYCVCLRV